MAEMNRIPEAAKKAPQTTQEKNESEIDLVELFYRLVEKAKYIIACALLGAVAMGAYTFFCVTPMYTATSKLYVLNSNGAAISLSDLQVGSSLASDYMEVFKNWHVHEMVIQRLGVNYSYKQLSNMVSVSNPTDTRILYITVTDADPNEAKLIADTYAQVAKEFIATTMDTEEPNLFEEALLPTSPSSPSKTKNIMLGFLLGLVIAAGVITVKFLMDDKIHSAEDIEKYVGLPTLGVMPRQATKAAAPKRGRKEDDAE